MKNVGKGNAKYNTPLSLAIKYFQNQEAYFLVSFTSDIDKSTEVKSTDWHMAYTEEKLEVQGN